MTSGAKRRRSRRESRQRALDRAQAEGVLDALNVLDPGTITADVLWSDIRAGKLEGAYIGGKWIKL